VAAASSLLLRVFSSIRIAIDSDRRGVAASTSARAAATGIESSSSSPVDSRGHPRSILVEISDLRFRSPAFVALPPAVLFDQSTAISFFDGHAGSRRIKASARSVLDQLSSAFGLDWLDPTRLPIGSAQFSCV
jgi:hypothetical protein